jgi:phage major head subunit gpT-like protein
MALIAAPITRSNAEHLLEEGVRDIFFNEYEYRMKQYPEIYTIKPSKKKTESDVVMAGAGQFVQKTEGNAPTFDSIQEAWRKQFTHNTWALALEITEEAREDDLYDVYTKLAGELGVSAAYTQDVQAMDLFNSLSATVYTAGGSNYTLLSTSHFRADGGTWSNRPTVAADLSIESLEALLVQWRTSMVDQRGRKIAPRPRVLMVGPSDVHIANRIVNSMQRPFTADNDVNTIRDYDLKVVVMDHLTDDGRWFLLADKKDTGLVWNQRAALSMRKRDDPRTGNLMFIARYRESHGTPHVTGAMGSP